MIDAKAAPQILEHLTKSVALTLHETRCAVTGRDAQSMTVAMRTIQATTAMSAQLSLMQMDSWHRKLCGSGSTCAWHGQPAGNGTEMAAASRGLCQDSKLCAATAHPTAACTANSVIPIRSIS
jgi:hypothetical protein